MLINVQYWVHKCVKKKNLRSNNLSRYILLGIYNMINDEHEDKITIGMKCELLSEIFFLWYKT